MKTHFARSMATLLALAIFCYSTPGPFEAKAIAAADGVDVTIPDGTEFTVVLDEEISSGSATEGDPVNFKIKDDVKIDGKVVIARDTLVKGTIANAQKAGRMGKGGKLGICVESTTAIDGQKVRLRASKGGEGGDKVGTVIVCGLSCCLTLPGTVPRACQSHTQASSHLPSLTPGSEHSHHKNDVNRLLRSFWNCANVQPQILYLNVAREKSSGLARVESVFSRLSSSYLNRRLFARPSVNVAQVEVRFSKVATSPKCNHGIPIAGTRARVAAVALSRQKQELHKTLKNR